MGSQDITTGRAPQAEARASGDLRLLGRLRGGEENAFDEIVGRYGAALLRVALVYTPSQAVAEEVVQETWLGVVRGLDRFEGRSSLATWLFRIVANRAKTRGQQEPRSVSFAALAADEIHRGEVAVDADRFTTKGVWSSPPARWDENQEKSLASRETVAVIEAAIAALPDTQRLVITIRDVGGWPADGVCDALGISEADHRVLLHRARSQVRRALEDYFGEDL